MSSEEDKEATTVLSPQTTEYFTPNTLSKAALSCSNSFTETESSDKISPSDKVDCIEKSTCALASSHFSNLTAVSDRATCVEKSATSLSSGPIIAPEISTTGVPSSDPVPLEAAKTNTSGSTLTTPRQRKGSQPKILKMSAKGQVEITRAELCGGDWGVGFDVDDKDRRKSRTISSVDLEMLFEKHTLKKGIQEDKKKEKKVWNSLFVKPWSGWKNKRVGVAVPKGERS
ncbi:hypothetical protein BKA69DRAFT_808651 [Paraphysoderma sedebokerense]|nr:hypothetical protein BKA69DRAFT_808651 [Paraphysoderma sedebokerense]